jgi:hypothetical protein
MLEIEDFRADFKNSYCYHNMDILAVNSKRSCSDLDYFLSEETAIKLINDVSFMYHKLNTSATSHTEYSSYLTTFDEIMKKLNNSLDFLILNFYIIEEIDFNPSILNGFLPFLHTNSKFKILLINSLYGYFKNKKNTLNKNMTFLDMIKLNKLYLFKASCILHNEIKLLSVDDKSGSIIRYKISDIYTTTYTKKSYNMYYDYDDKFYDMYDIDIDTNSNKHFYLPDILFPKFKEEFNLSEIKTLQNIIGDKCIITEVLENIHFQCYIIIKDLPIIHTLFKEIKKKKLLKTFINIHSPLFSYIILNASYYRSEIKCIVNYLYKNDKKLLEKLIPIIYFSTIKNNAGSITKLIPVDILKEFDHTTLIHKINTINFLYKKFFLTDSVTYTFLTNNLMITSNDIGKSNLFVNTCNSLLDLYPLYHLSIDLKISLDDTTTAEINYCSIYSILIALEKDLLNTSKFFNVLEITGNNNNEYFRKRCNEIDMTEVEKAIKQELYNYENNIIISSLGTFYDNITINYNTDEYSNTKNDHNYNIFKVNTDLLFEEVMTIRNNANTDTNILLSKFAVSNNIYYPKNDNGLNFFKEINKILEFETNILLTQNNKLTILSKDPGIPINILESNILNIEDILNYLMYKKTINFNLLQKALEKIFPQYTFTSLNQFLVNILYLIISNIDLVYMYSDFSSLCKEFVNNIKNDFVNNNTYEIILKLEDHKIDMNKPFLKKFYSIIKELEIKLPPESTRIIKLLSSYNKIFEKNTYYKHYIFGSYSNDRDNELSFILLNRSLFHNIDIKTPELHLNSRSIVKLNIIVLSDMTDSVYFSARMLTDLFWFARRYQRKYKIKSNLTVNDLGIISRQVLFNITGNNILKSKYNFLNMHILLCISTLHGLPTIKDNIKKELLAVIKESGNTNLYLAQYSKALTNQITELKKYKIKNNPYLTNIAYNDNSNNINDSLLFTVLKRNNTGIIKLFIKDYF